MFISSYNESQELPAEYLSDGALTEFYDGRVVVCSDVVIADLGAKTIYLAERIHTPAEGYWPFGGQRKRGETAEQTAIRRLRAETNGQLAVDASRLTLVGIAEHRWDYRQEAMNPAFEGSGGRHDLNFVYVLDTTASERDLITANLDTNEYEASAGLTAFNSVAALTAEQARQPLIDYYRAIFPDSE